MGEAPSEDTDVKHYTIAIFHGLGDCFNATVLLRPLKDRESCTIRWVTHRDYAGIVDNNPHVDEVELFDGDKWACDEHYAAVRAREGTTVLAPAPYMTGPRHIVHPEDTLLGRFASYAKTLGLEVSEPLLYLRDEERRAANDWLAERCAGDYVLMEVAYTSNQSFWDDGLTRAVIAKIREAGLTPVIGHLATFADAEIADLPYRVVAALYDRAAGFIGVSSGVSCLVHGHEARKDVPHLEFVRGEHWCTRLYAKEKKKIVIGNVAVLSEVDQMLRTIKESR